MKWLLMKRGLDIWRIKMVKVKFRLGMMCDLGPEYDSKLCSEIDLPKEEAKELEPFKNENGEVILMGSNVGDYDGYRINPHIR